MVEVLARSVRYSLIAAITCGMTACGVASPKQASSNPVTPQTEQMVEQAAAAPEAAPASSAAAADPLPNSPAVVTDYAIGDAIDPDRVDESTDQNGNVDLAKVPLWAAVGADGVIIGYMKNLEALGWGSAGGRPSGADAGLIYDETGTNVIGHFVDGVPRIEPVG